jgi:hypothetical protein
MSDRHQPGTLIGIVRNPQVLESQKTIWRKPTKKVLIAFIIAWSALFCLIALIFAWNALR